MMKFSQQDQHQKWIAAGKISVIWRRAQRTFSERLAKEIADDLDPDSFGSLIVTEPDATGVYHCVDGQHRAAAVRALYGASETVPCIVLPAKDPAECARIWLRMNTHRRSATAIDAFLVEVTAEIPTSVAIQKLLTSLGLKVTAAQVKKSIRCVRALKTIFNTHGHGVLRDALVIIGQTWGDDETAHDGSIVTGLAIFLSQNPTCDRTRIVTRLQKKYTPLRLIAAAKSGREIHRMTLIESICLCIIKEYNTGLSAGKRLDEILRKRKAKTQGAPQSRGRGIERAPATPAAP